MLYEVITTSAPAGIRNLTMGSQKTHYAQLDADREKGCIRSVEKAYNKDGGLAVLKGNIRITSYNVCYTKLLRSSM